MALFLVVCVVTICNICPYSNMLMLRRPSYNNIGLESIVGFVLQQMLSDRNLISMIRLFILFVHLWNSCLLFFFLYQFSTSFPSFSLDVSRAALFSACESVVATLFWKHLFRDFLDYCLFFVLLLHKIQPHKRKMKSNKNNDVLSVSGLVCSWYCKPLPPVSLLVLKSRRFFQEGSTFTAAA